MLNQFIVVGKVEGVNYSTEIVTISTSKGFAFFNTNAKDIIDIKIPNIISAILDGVNIGDTLMAKGSMESAGMGGSVVLIAKQAFVVNRSVEISDVPFGINKRVFLKDYLGKTFKGTIIGINEKRGPNLKYSVRLDNDESEIVFIGEDRLMPLDE